LFTGKELDEDTQLYYFGARYYDPRTSVWQSPDPILASYLKGARSGGGVFAPVNLSSYNYAHNRPVRLTDPNGAWVEDVFIGVPSIGIGLWSIGSNIWEGNWGAAAIDAGGIVADAAAIVTPGVPGGAGLGIKATREGVEATARRRVDDVASDMAEQGTRQVDEATDASRMADELRTGDGPIHHVCTDKNCVSTARGGPWTPRFQEMFDKAGMDMQDVLNRVRVPGHKGPHPEEYHNAVFQRLSDAVQGLDGDAYRAAFQRELGAIRTEVATPGSVLNRLVVKE